VGFPDQPASLDECCQVNKLEPILKAASHCGISRPRRYGQAAPAGKSHKVLMFVRCQWPGSPWCGISRPSLAHVNRFSGPNALRRIGTLMALGALGVARTSDSRTRRRGPRRPSWPNWWTNPFPEVEDPSIGGRKIPAGGQTHLGLKPGLAPCGISRPGYWAPGLRTDPI
jgi:hypothetical protein